MHTAEYIRKNVNIVDWNEISYNQILPESFIREFKNKVNWQAISSDQKLSEPFIAEFQDKVYWNWISQYQQLSEPFIEKFKNRVNWRRISIYQKLSKNFIQLFKNRLTIKSQLKRHHNKLSYQQKLEIAKRYAKKYDLKCDSEHLYAYREHDEFNRGMFSNITFYDKKGIYTDWHCDLNPAIENSFGLGIFPKGNIKIRIKIKDIGCWPNNSNKLRVWAFEII